MWLPLPSFYYLMMSHGGQVQYLCSGSNYRVITLLRLPRKVYSRVLEKRSDRLLNPRFRRSDVDCRPDQLFILARGAEGVMGVPWGAPVRGCSCEGVQTPSGPPPKSNMLSVLVGPLYQSIYIPTLTCGQVSQRMSLK